MPTFRPLKVALTIDDLFMWPGVPFPEHIGPHAVSKQLTDAFARHGFRSVYAFSCTRPTEDDRSFLTVLDTWCEAGHHVGNHTHAHCSLNWTSVEKYLDDMDRSGKILARYIDQAPTRYFRFAFDMWGDEKAKTDAVLEHLTKTNFAYAPISMWFYDAQFAVPHIRAMATGNQAAVKQVEDMFVESTLSQLRNQADGARAAFGRDPVHIVLLHGTPIVGATIDRLLAGMLQLGVQPVSLEEAMRDAANVIVPPLTTRLFRNSTQKWAELQKVTLVDTPPALLHALHDVAPVPGFDEATLFGNAFDAMAKVAGGTSVPGDFYS